jgi:hypothetical protein
MEVRLDDPSGVGAQFNAAGKSEPSYNTHFFQNVVAHQHDICTMPRSRYFLSRFRLVSDHLRHTPSLSKLSGSSKGCPMPRCFAVSGVFVAAVATIGLAASPTQTPRAVHDALPCGTAGDAVARRELFQSVVSSQPDLIVARGHLGQVRRGKEWVDFERLVQLPEEIERRTEYESARQAAPDNLEGQLELANWCRQRGLNEQERVHLNRVLEFDSEHAAARNRLGFFRRNSEWVSGSEQRFAEARYRDQVAKLRKWRPQVHAIVAGLIHKHKASPVDAREREKYLGKLAAITDPAALAAFELELAAYLATLGSQPGSPDHRIEFVILPLVRAIGRIPQPEAAQVLARLATELALTVPIELPETFVMETFGPRYPSAEELSRVSSITRRLPRELSAAYSEIIEQLRRHPRDSFVPLLLSGLSSPVQGEFLAYRQQDGDMVVRLFYQRETESRRETQENRTLLNSMGSDMSGMARSISLSGERANLQLESAHQQLQQVNQVVLQRNVRVTDVLRAVTDEPLSTMPQSWWDWWNAENEVFVDKEKPLVSKVHKQSIAVIAPPPPPPPRPTYSLPTGGPGMELASVETVGVDCLAAGTPIWTTRGYTPIEKIIPGDLVLAQHPESGELAYKPVLKTTTRPPGPIVVIRAGGETFRTSGGHPFWVVGEGWVRARRLKAGREFHTVGGASMAAIEHVEISRDSEPTYNLVVADFHSYFVGATKVLSHDNTVRAPTGMTLPGVAKTVRPR